MFYRRFYPLIVRLTTRLTPSQRVLPCGLGYKIWSQKTRVHGLPDGVNRIDPIPACDEQTDGQTDGRHAAHSCRA